MLEFLCTVLLLFGTFVVMFIAGCAVSLWLLVLEWAARVGIRLADYIESKHKKGQ